MVEQIRQWCRVGDVLVHYVEYGGGTPVLVLHGAGADHRETEACFEPALGARGGYRRIYPDLPGMGLTAAPTSLRSADDVLDTLLGFADEIAGPGPLLVAGHSAGAHYAQGLANRWAERVAGLALVCPLLGGVRDVPEHRAVVSADIGDDEFRAYFVVQTPEMLDRYERFVTPAAPLADQPSMERIGERWELTTAQGPPYGGPTLVVAGRQDATVGYAAAADLVHQFPRATVAILDGAGHALPHEQPEMLRELLDDWMARAAHHTRPDPKRPLNAMSRAGHPGTVHERHPPITTRLGDIAGRRCAEASGHELSDVDISTPTGHAEHMREVISTPNAPRSPFYSQGIKAGGHVFVSGLVGIDVTTGQVAGSSIEQQTRQALANCEAVLHAAGAALSDVVEVGVLLHDPDDFAGMNEEWVAWFPVDPPTRSVAKLGAVIPGILVSVRMTAFHA